ncbi:MAG: hypothetical protein HQM08_20340 [Candidatus Riflebacteria bacterium]|nr:hypothetical protein [Candidatus Riflebacteria bacterium]
MKKFINFFLLVFLFALVFPLYSLDNNQKVVDDLTKSYEVWKNQGIKFVIRQNGQFDSWGTGRLESWNNTSKWVVRDGKGRFLIHATGGIENWKTGKTFLVIRDNRGRILTRINIDLTSRASFAKNVVGLRRLNADHKYIGFVQETLTELLINELKSGDNVRTKVLLDYIKKYKNEKSGMSNFKPVLKEVSKQLNFMAIHDKDSVTQDLALAAKQMYSEL